MLVFSLLKTAPSTATARTPDTPNAASAKNDNKSYVFYNIQYIKENRIAKNREICKK